MSAFSLISPIWWTRASNCTRHLPAGQGEALAWLYRHGRVLDRVEDDAGGAQVSVRLDDQALGQFERLFPQVALG